MFYRIVVPTDFSDCAREAWELARRVATTPGSELVVVHVLTEVPLYGEGVFDVEPARKVREAARTWAGVSEINPLTVGSSGAPPVDARARLSR